MKWQAVTCLVFLSLAAPVRATTIDLTGQITCPGFEVPALAAQDSGIEIVADVFGNTTGEGAVHYGWEFLNGQLDYIVNPSTATAWTTVGSAPSEGACHLGFSNYSLATESGNDWANFRPLVARQTLSSATFAANTRYTLTVDIGKYTEGNYAGYGFGLADTSTARWGCSLADNDFLVDAAVGSNFSTVRDTTGASPTTGNWLTLSTSFTTGPSGAFIGDKIGILLWSGNLGGFKTGFDNVRLTAESVPEPCAWTMIVTGMVGLLAYAWRRRKCVSIASVE